ncbi:unnamed protein product, partial [Symbiodinium natans]
GLGIPPNAEVVDMAEAGIREAMKAATELLPGVVARWRSHECVPPREGSLLQADASSTKHVQLERMWHPECKQASVTPSLPKSSKPVVVLTQLVEEARPLESKFLGLGLLDESGANDNKLLKLGTNLSEKLEFDSTAWCGSRWPEDAFVKISGVSRFAGAMQQAVYNAWAEMQTWQDVHVQLRGSKMSQELTEIHDQLKARIEKGSNSMHMFSEAFLVDDCQLQWQNYHEIIYKSAENLEVNTDSLQIYRRQAKDALWYATMQKLGRDSEALCSYENTCVKTFWWTAEKCHVTDSLEITVEKPTGLTESKARCNILPHCRFIVCDADAEGVTTCKLYSLLTGTWSVEGKTEECYAKRPHYGPTHVGFEDWKASERSVLEALCPFLLDEHLVDDSAGHKTYPDTECKYTRHYEYLACYNQEKVHEKTCASEGSIALDPYDVNAGEDLKKSTQDAEDARKELFNDTYAQGIFGQSFNKQLRSVLTEIETHSETLEADVGESRIPKSHGEVCMVWGLKGTVCSNMRLREKAVPQALLRAPS